MVAAEANLGAVGVAAAGCSCTVALGTKPAAKPASGFTFAFAAEADFAVPVGIHATFLWYTLLVVAFEISASPWPNFQLFDGTFLARLSYSNNVGPSTHFSLHLRLVSHREPHPLVGAFAQAE